MKQCAIRTVRLLLYYSEMMTVVCERNWQQFCGRKLFSSIIIVFRNYSLLDFFGAKRIIEIHKINKPKKKMSWHSSWIKRKRRRYSDQLTHFFSLRSNASSHWIHFYKIQWFDWFKTTSMKNDKIHRNCSIKKWCCARDFFRYLTHINTPNKYSEHALNRNWKKGKNSYSNFTCCLTFGYVVNVTIIAICQWHSHNR